MQDHLTTRELADELGTDEWRVRRLFEDGTLPEPQRFAGKRAISRNSIPDITEALCARKWLEPRTKTTSSDQTKNGSE